MQLTCHDPSFATILQNVHTDQAVTHTGDTGDALQSALGASQQTMPVFGALT